MGARFWFGLSMFFIGWGVAWMRFSAMLDMAGWVMSHGLLVAAQVGFAVYWAGRLRGRGRR